MNKGGGGAPCVACNPGARGKGEQEPFKTDIPTVYVGETSRSIYERSREHWEGAGKGSNKNHMVRHQVLEHGGEPAPDFHMIIKGYYKTALARQVEGRELSSTPGESFQGAIYLGSK